MNKVIALLVLVLMAFFAFGCAQNYNTDQNPAQAGEENSKGRVIFAITDAAAEMGSVTSVRATVSSIMVHSSAKGWVTVSSSSKTYDLLELKAESKNELLADVQLEEGEYDQIRLDISRITVVDSEGEHEAKMPSNEIKINANLAVKENTTSTASFDFIADESLHITGNGKYIMAPVVKLETREDADAEVKSNNEVEIKGGKTKTNVKVGMDEKGNVGIGLKIPVDVNINLDVSGGISLGTSDETEMELGKGRVVFAVKDKAADMGSVTKIKVTIENVKVQSAAGTWTTVSSSPKTYDLLELNSKNEAMLLADVQLDKGVYNQVRLNISKVVVTDSEGDHEAKLPSGDLKIIGKLYVNENSTSTTTVDFEANQSLHKTGNDEYLLAPVVKFETRDNAEVSIKNNVVDIEKGTVRTNIEIGMDSKGNVGIGLKINANADISI